MFEHLQSRKEGIWSTIIVIRFWNNAGAVDTMIPHQSGSNASMPLCDISNFSGRLVDRFGEEIIGIGELWKNSGPFLLKNWRIRHKDAPFPIQMIRIYGYWVSYDMLVPLGQFDSETVSFRFDDTIEINAYSPPPRGTESMKPKSVYTNMNV